MRLIRLAVMAVCAALLVAAPGARASSVQDRADEAEIAALDLEQQGNLDASIAKHREALALVPNNKAFKENFAHTLNAAGIQKYNAKDYAGAVACFEEALRMVPNFKTAKDNLTMVKGEKMNNDGMDLFKKGDFAGAIAKFNELLSLFPDYKPAIINRDAAEAQVAMTAGDPATAVAKLTEAVTLKPDSAFLKGKLAEAQAALDAKKAEEAKNAKPK